MRRSDLKLPHKKGTERFELGFKEYKNVLGDIRTASACRKEFQEVYGGFQDVL